jgi:hypothetical protein
VIYADKYSIKVWDWKDAATWGSKTSIYDNDGFKTKGEIEYDDGSSRATTYYKNHTKLDYVTQEKRAITNEVWHQYAHDLDGSAVDHFWDAENTTLEEWWYTKDASGKSYRGVTYFDDTTHVEEGWDLRADGKTWLHVWWRRGADGGTIEEGSDNNKPPTLTPISTLTSTAAQTSGKPPSGWELMSAADLASWQSGLLDSDPSERSDAHNHPTAPAERHVASMAADENLLASDHKDVFTFNHGFGHDTISGFEAGPGFIDVIELKTSALADIKAVYGAAKQVGSDVVITVDSGDSITLKNVKVANLTWDDFRFVA